ncbi:hypothetical protein AVEN_40515-1 [Araneus ventricosus]|uniref:Uncharacterized protein n=1 Tax=Araneus ventricosus TaxID=182803 RepID=A0A4Y2WVQ3_ARAVE|nr:hypothetical protein AVEN_40515-1 [Araneus ventricosus]
MYIDERGRGGLVVRSRPRDRRVAGSRPDSTEDPPLHGACCTPNHDVVAKRPPVAWRGSLRGVPAQVSSFRHLTAVQNMRSVPLPAPRVASKRDVNIT